MTPPDPQKPVPVPPDSPSKPAGPARSRWWRSRNEVAGLFLLALLVRAGAAYMSPAILNDSVSLLRSAGRIGREGWASVLPGPDHPLTAWLIAMAPAGWDPESTGTALAVFAGALAVWPLHVLARRACGRHAATAASIVYAGLPKAVGVSSVPLTSAVFLPLFLSGLSLAFAAAVPSSPKRRIVRLVSSGLMCGAAYLCRPEGLVAAAGAVAATLFLARRGRKWTSAAIVAGAFLVVALPYVVAISSPGHPALSPKKDWSRFVGTADAPLDGSETSGSFQAASSALEGALTAPVILLLLAGAFLPGRWRHPRSSTPRALLVGIAAVSFVLVARLHAGWGYANARHLLPGALLLVPFAGEGFLFVGVFISRVIARRRLTIVLATFFAIPCAVKALIRPEGEDQADARALGELLAERTRAAGGTSVVISSFREPVVAYYADRALEKVGGSVRDVPLWGRHKGLLDDAADEAARAELATRLRSEGAQWFVIDVFRKPSGSDVAPGLRLVGRLVEDGVIAVPATAAGSNLAAFPVR